MIDKVLNAILPGSEALGLPSATKLDFALYQKDNLMQGVTEDFLSELSLIATEKFETDFDNLDDQQRMNVINNCKIKNFRIFSVFIKHCFRFYYSNKQVLSVLNVGSTPPFPQGNILDEDDWEILEPVLERGYTCRITQN
jgi:hypothetical protein